MKYWEQLTLNFMTEESDDMSDSNYTIIEHKLTLRSQGMQHMNQGRSQAIRRVGSLRTKGGPSFVILEHSCPS